MSLPKYGNKELKRQVLSYLKNWLDKEEHKARKEYIENLIRQVKIMKV